MKSIKDGHEHVWFQMAVVLRGRKVSCMTIYFADDMFFALCAPLSCVHSETELVINNYVAILLPSPQSLPWPCW